VCLDGAAAPKETKTGRRCRWSGPSPDTSRRTTPRASVLLLQKSQRLWQGAVCTCMERKMFRSLIPCGHRGERRLYRVARSRCRHPPSQCSHRPTPSSCSLQPMRRRLPACQQAPRSRPRPRSSSDGTTDLHGVQASNRQLIRDRGETVRIGSGVRGDAQLAAYFCTLNASA